MRVTCRLALLGVLGCAPALSLSVAKPAMRLKGGAPLLRKAVLAWAGPSLLQNLGGSFAPRLMFKAYGCGPPIRRAAIMATRPANEAAASQDVAAMLDDTAPADPLAKEAGPSTPGQEQAAENKDPSIEFKTWPKIGQLQSAIKALSCLFSPARARMLEEQGRADESAAMPTSLQFKAKVKVDGTNAGVVLSKFGNRVGAQSRSRLLSKTADNNGFHAWVASTEDYWLSVAAKLPGATVFGEWAGPKINDNGQAVAKIGRRIFAVFGIKYREEHTMEVCPARIRALLPEHPDVFVLPWCATFDFDFSSRDAIYATRNAINELVWSVEKVDPWVKDNFAVEGKGEGVVVYRTDALRGDAPVATEEVVPFMFKAKAEYARVVRQDAPAQLETSVFANAEALAEAFVTRARVNQAIRECVPEGEELVTEGPVSGMIAKWIVKDILEEGAAEIAASNLDGKKQARTLQNAIRDRAVLVLNEEATDRALEAIVALAVAGAEGPAAAAAKVQA